MATVAELMAVLRLKDELSPGINSAMKTVTGAVAGMLTLGAAVKVATDALEAQGEQEAAMTKLNLALANQGTYSKATSDSLVAYASSLQEVSTVADEVILGAEAMFVRFGLNEEQTKRATKAALDLAAATGQDLNSAVMAIQKGIEGHTKGLAALNVTVDASASEHQRFESVLAQVESRVGGSALAATQTYAGQMAQLKNQVGEVEEGMGKFLGTILDLQGGTNVGLSALKGISDFFGKTLVTVVAEARGWILDFIADFATSFAALGNWLATHPIIAKAFGIDPKLMAETGSFFKEYSKNLHEQADAVRLAGDYAAAAAGKTQTFANNTHVAAGYSKEAKAAADDQAKALDELEKGARKWDMTMLNVMIDQHKWTEDMMTAISTQTINKMMEERAERIDDAKTAYMGMLHAQIEADNSAVAGAREAAEALERRNEAIYDAIERTANAFEDVGEALQSLGVSADSIFGKVLSNAQNLANAAGGIFKAFTSGDIIDKISAVAKGIGAVGKALGGLFKNKEIEKVNDLRDAFFQAHGGFEALAVQLAKSGQDALVKKIFDAKTVEQFNALVKETQGILDMQGQAQEDLNAAVEKYGFTVDELGPKWKQQELDKQAGSLLKDYELLIASGIDVNTVIAKMGPNFSAYVDTALKAGVAIPESMHATIDQLYKSGQLLHENGDAFTEAEYNGLSFTQSLSDGMKDVVEQIKALVAALTGVKVPPIQIPYSYHQEGPGPHEVPAPEDVPHYARGTSFVPRTGLAVVHRGEAIIPAGQNAAAGGADLAREIRQLRGQLTQQLHPNALAKAFTAAVQLA